jgi:hypothetical protein
MKVIITFVRHYQCEVEVTDGIKERELVTEATNCINEMITDGSLEDQHIEREFISSIADENGKVIMGVL